ncbi:MAG: hypothetical protein ACYTEL_01340 [Planctomycetota bacterium]|jgi:WD40 repeat protein
MKTRKSKLSLLLSIGCREEESIAVSAVAAGLLVAAFAGSNVFAMARRAKIVAEAPKVRIDSYGDPLPAGAVGRLGTCRLRHQGRAIAVIYSPDGRTIVSGGDDRAVVVWEADSGRVLHRLLGHTGKVYAVALSRDGRILASGSRVNGQVILWDAKKGRKLLELPRQDSVHWLAFAPDGKMLATVSASAVHLCDVATGSEVRQFEGRRVFWVGFAGNGKAIAAAGGRGTESSWLRLFSVADGKEMRSFEVTKINSAALSLDGRLLAAGSADGSVNIWEVESGESIGQFGPQPTGHNCNVSLAFSPDSKLLASVGDSRGSRAIRVMSLETQKELTRCEGHYDGGLSICFSADGNKLVSGGMRGRVKVWDIGTGKAILAPAGHWGTVRYVAFLAGEDRVVTQGTDNTARLWKTAGCQHQNMVRAYWRSAPSADGRLLAIPGNNGTIRVVDIQAGQILHVLMGHKYFVNRLAFSADGLTLASLDREGFLRVWDVVTGKQIVAFASRVSMGTIIFSPDGKTLATASQMPMSKFSDEDSPKDREYPIRLWDASTGEKWGDFGAADDPVASLAFSPDGKLLASGHGLLEKPTGPGDAVESTNTVRLWQVETGKPVNTLKGHTAAVASVAFSGDGKTLASGSLDGTVRLWQVRAGKQTAVLKGHGLAALEGIEYDEVYAVAFSPDENILASGAKDGTVLLWVLDDVLRTGGVEPKTVEGK